MPIILAFNTELATALVFLIFFYLVGVIGVRKKIISYKDLYTPGQENYLQPSRYSEKLSYLIIQSDTNGEENKDWIEKYRNYHKLVDKTKVGGIAVEKCNCLPDQPNDYCIWWGRCD